MRAEAMIEPGRVIGILGGGQLGRMAALAAATLGYRCHIFSPERECPAKLVTPFATTAAYSDRDALIAFAKAVDIITFEFENVPVEAVELLASIKPMRPGPRILGICQDRLAEKDFLRAIDVATAPYRDVANEEGLKRAVRDIGPRSVLKTVRLGYDGKGQVMLNQESDLAAAWRQLNTTNAILEAHIDFASELSVIVARGANGAWAIYPAVENHHVNHILDTTIAPARVSSGVAMRAEATARHIAEKLEVVGLLAVEMFVTASGDILVNELAPRPHNSGHWTIDACYTSQFEQLVRAICGLPLGSGERHSDAVMKNLIGGDIEKWHDALMEPAAKLHLYGKESVVPGRKMGHVTRLSPKR
ncbi:MAG TPA: 5-(carboxyamino)imidazole ribonucleotide synthase [Stellaceae bacterium]|nr:5-(carboxyamino)imidazole ribonucleotide synthase [Stellaceae bacterium]